MMNNSKTRILCIEDDAGLARLLERRLKRHGYELEWAADGIAGLERMAQASFDVVAIDYEMPGLDGLTVLERMKSLSGAPPAIMISGAGDMDTAIAALKAGAADYVVKTVDGNYIDLLPRTIERILETERLQALTYAAQLALEEKTKLLSLTLSSISQGLTVFNNDLHLITWNELWLSLLDVPHDFAQVGAPLDSFEQLHAHLGDGCEEARMVQSIRKVRDNGPQVGEYRLHTGITLEVRSSPMPDGGVVTVYTDITDRKLAEEDQRVAAAVFQTTAEPMLITDAKVLTERCNPAFETLLGYSEEELVGRNPGFLASDNHDPAFFKELWRCLHADGHWRGTIWNCHKDGRLLAQQVTISAIDNGRKQIGHYVAVYSDVTEQVRREMEVRHQAHHDALTGLPNRSLLMDRIDQAAEAAKRDQKGFALLFLDLDGFKPINDDFGHHAGDRLLKEIARRLVARCRDSDTVARYGGDEFVILLRNADDMSAVSAVAESLIEQIGSPVTIDDVLHKVGASIGIALYPQHGNSTSTLLKNADEAMYQAKAAGRSRHKIYTASA